MEHKRQRDGVAAKSKCIGPSAARSHSLPLAQDDKRKVAYCLTALPVYTYSETDLEGMTLQAKRFRDEKKIAMFAESNAPWRNISPEIFQTIGVPPLRQAQGRDFREKGGAA